MRRIDSRAATRTLAASGRSAQPATHVCSSARRDRSSPTDTAPSGWPSLAGGGAAGSGRTLTAAHWFRTELCVPRQLHLAPTAFTLLVTKSPIIGYFFTYFVKI